MDQELCMDALTLKPERMAQLEEYARRRGQDPEVALDEALGAYFDWERQDFEEAGDGIRQGYADVKAGRTRAVSEFLSDMRRKHGLPGLSSARHSPDCLQQSASTYVLVVSDQRDTLGTCRRCY